MMFNGLFGLGRAYKKLPPHNSFRELANNVDRLADYLIDRSLGDFGREGYKKASGRWENQLGKDLKMLLRYARAYVPDDADAPHYFSKPRRRSNPP